MDQKYVWKLKPVDKRLMIHLECHREKKEFEAQAPQQEILLGQQLRTDQIPTQRSLAQIQSEIESPL